MKPEERADAMHELDELNAEIEELEDEIEDLRCHNFASDATEEDEGEIENEILYLESYHNEAEQKRKVLLNKFPEIRNAANSGGPGQ